jgi:hypothetical protein
VRGTQKVRLRELAHDEKDRERDGEGKTSGVGGSVKGRIGHTASSHDVTINSETPREDGR